jgi:hypothetical protein
MSGETDGAGLGLGRRRTGIPRFAFCASVTPGVLLTIAINCLALPNRSFRRSFFVRIVARVREIGSTAAVYAAAYAPVVTLSTSAEN